MEHATQHYKKPKKERQITVRRICNPELLKNPKRMQIPTKINKQSPKKSSINYKNTNQLQMLPNYSWKRLPDRRHMAMGIF